jgi:hypothetical protein
VLGPQASPPARVARNPGMELFANSIRSLMQLTWLVSTRAGEDACGHSTTILILFSQRLSRGGSNLLLQITPKFG